MVFCTNPDNITKGGFTAHPFYSHTSPDDERTRTKLHTSLDDETTTKNPYEVSAPTNRAHSIPKDLKSVKNF